MGIELKIDRWGLGRREDWKEDWEGARGDKRRRNRKRMEEENDGRKGR